MRTVVQRVSRAEVTVAGRSVGRIGTGLLVLVGVTHDDTETDAVVLADKLVGLRIFPDDDGAMNRASTEVGGEMLIVSQFTLYGSARRGKRPSFTDAAPPERAEGLIETMVDRVRQLGVRCETGQFGARMEVELVNDGPVTLLLETRAGRIS
ncbi:MAG TPA: D-aminoacyl-tRNA deacylase [Acidimicrobiia bacterium]|nr:D-aminoacyl-tRNA deacylase [Acidimicrobiia bacterium]